MNRSWPDSSGHSKQRNNLSKARRRESFAYSWETSNFVVRVGVNRVDPQAFVMNYLLVHGLFLFFAY